MLVIQIVLTKMVIILPYIHGEQVIFIYFDTIVKNKYDLEIKLKIKMYLLIY